MAVSFIELPENNLYVNGYLQTLSDGRQLLFREPLNILPQEGDEYHTLRANEPLDLVAYVRYNKKVEDASKWWWIIMDANKIPNPLDLSEYVGKNLLIPDVLRIKAQLG